MCNSAALRLWGFRWESRYVGLLVCGEVSYQALALCRRSIVDMWTVLNSISMQIMWPFIIIVDHSFVRYSFNLNVASYCSGTYHLLLIITIIFMTCPRGIWPPDLCSFQIQAMYHNYQCYFHNWLVWQWSVFDDLGCKVSNAVHNQLMWLKITSAVLNLSDI